MNKEKICIIFLIILGLIITLFLGGRIYREGFSSSNSTVFTAVPISNPNSPKVTVFYPNNDVKTLNLTNGSNTITYTLTNTTTTGLQTFMYDGSDNSKAKLTLTPNNTGPDANIKQTLVITDISGKNTPYGTTTPFIDPTSSSSSDTLSSSTSANSSNISSNYDNYNHFTGTSSTLTNDKTFYGPNGGVATMTTNSDGTQVIKVTLSSNDNPIIFTPSKFNISGEIFYGPHGGTATIVDNNGKKAIIVKNKNGVYIYKLQDQNQYDSQYNMSSTQYFGSTGYTTYPFQSTAYTDNNYQANNSMSSTINNMANTISDALNPTNTQTSTSYNSSLPQGIPRSQIPKGQEDLYILKSEVVPPVCPACPAAASCPRQEPCPACPPCGRCPEPSFECKKVPNYNAINNQYLPAPFVNSFASFGK